jgi:hypothetical protein
MDFTKKMEAFLGCNLEDRMLISIQNVAEPTNTYRMNISKTVRDLLLND